MIRRIVLWAWSGKATAELKLRAKEGLAYISYASRVDGMDFGEDLGLGETTNYGLAMERDHVDRASWDSYNDDPHHDRVGSYIDSITLMDRTARIDHEHDGQLAVRGSLRHVAMYTWSDSVSLDDRRVAQDAVRSLLAASPSVRASALGDDLGWRGGHADWVAEALFDDAASFTAWRGSPEARQIATKLAAVTLPDRGAQIQHLVHSG